MKLAVVRPENTGPYSGIAWCVDRCAKQLGIESFISEGWAREIIDFDPDVVILPELVQWFYLGRGDQVSPHRQRRDGFEVLRWCRKHDRASVLFLWDLPWTWPWPARRIGSLFEWNCMCEPRCLGLLPKTIYLPHAYEEERHKPGTFRPEYRSGVLVVGNSFANRVVWIEPVKEWLDRLPGGFVTIGKDWPWPSVSPHVENPADWIASADLVLNLHRGRNWMPSPPPIGQAGWTGRGRTNGWASGERVRGERWHFHARHAIWNFDPDGDETHEEPSDLGALNERVFHYTVQGAIQVVDDREMIARAIPELPRGRGPTEILETCRRLIADPSERRERLAAVRRRVYGHTYRARLAYLLRRIGFHVDDSRLHPLDRLDPEDFSPAPDEVANPPEREEVRGVGPPQGAGRDDGRSPRASPAPRPRVLPELRRGAHSGGGHGGGHPGDDRKGGGRKAGGRRR